MPLIQIPAQTLVINSAANIIHTLLTVNIAAQNIDSQLQSNGVYTYNIVINGTNTAIGNTFYAGNSITSTSLSFTANSAGNVFSFIASYGPSAPSTYIFDFYVSTTGNDSNNGLTPATAWAFTSFNNTGSTNNAKMAGKKIGIVAGTYNLSQLTSGHTGSGDYTWSLMNLPGGTSTSPTVVASCNASGVYTPRVAIIFVDVLNNNGCIGGGGGQAGGGTASYITVDGLTVNGNNIGG